MASFKKTAKKVERHKEIVRQWRILRRIASAADATPARLATEFGVCRRTIYRDRNALEAAGFIFYEVEGDGNLYWRLNWDPFKRLTDTGFTVSELCAFYVNRSMFAAAAGSPVEDDLHSALEKLTKALSPKMRAYLDRLTTVLTWKAEPGRRGGTRAEARYREDIVRATLEHRTIEMTYHSLSSRRVKNYRVEPYRLTFGNGGLYLFAFVPIYGQMRSFAVHRVQALRVLEESFSAVQELSGEPYRHSFGVFTGKPEPVRILFTPSVAPYVEEGQWHESQALEKQPDGSVVLAMNVCVDLALRSWILGFGHQARVLKPSSLAETILEELEEAREQYAPRMSFELPPAIYDEKQLPLSFTGSRGPARRPRPTSSNGRRQVPPPPPAPAHRRKAAGE